MCIHHRVWQVLCGFSLLSALWAHAEPNLSLDEAMHLASQNQPLLESLDVAASASREAAIAAGQLPDPKLKFGVLNLPVTGSDAARLNRDDMTMSTIGVMQDVVPRSKRDAAARAMEAASGQYQTEKSSIVRTIRRDIALAWLNVFEAERRRELYQKAADEMAAERQVMLSQISAGGTQAVEVFKLDAELSMLNDKRLMALRDERLARAALARWIGAAAQRPLGALPLATADGQGQAAKEALEQHPAVLNARQMEMVAQSEADMAKAGRDLDWSWEVMYGKRRSDLSDMVSVQVAIDLPWDRSNRQDKRLAEKLLLVEKARKLTEDRKRELDAELENAMAELDTAKMREQEHQARLIPAARSRLQLAQATYSAGKGSLAEIWDARQALIGVEMEHWIILTDRQRAAAKIDYLLDNSRLNQEQQP
ncbi:MAG TPA: TolC family protein [Methylophilaceae bacterium]|jgi:cobalt-zinc-cadmium efflux system outer membrane protein|nr:TolC family protein [Methylophilaceae bacterium]